MFAATLSIEKNVFCFLFVKMKKLSIISFIFIILSHKLQTQG